jgi:hypothetical protein
MLIDIIMLTQDGQLQHIVSIIKRNIQLDKQETKVSSSIKSKV